MRNILITGVSRGLGLEIAKVLVNENWKIWGISRTKTPELEKLIEKNSDRIEWEKFDLTKTEDVKEEIFNNFINLDIKLHGFVNNAAIAYDDLITNLKEYSLNKMYKINVYTPMMIVKYAIRNMLLHHINGSIVHISSISVHTGYKGLAMYASTKGAIEAFSKNTAREWGPKNIRSNCVVAGFMDTNMSSSLSQKQKDRIYNRTSLKKATSTKSVAETVNYLLSDKAKSITGQNFHVDSGTI